MNREEKNNLLLTYIPLIKSVLSSYTKDQTLYDDLFQHICYSLLTSKNCFPSKLSINWAIKKYFRDHYSLVRTRKATITFVEFTKKHSGCTENSYLSIEMDIALSKLPRAERDLVYSYFYLDLPITNRSSYMKKSRALNKLKAHLS